MAQFLVDQKLIRNSTNYTDCRCSFLTFPKRRRCRDRLQWDGLYVYNVRDIRLRSPPNTSLDFPNCVLNIVSKLGESERLLLTLKGNGEKLEGVRHVMYTWTDILAFAPAA